MKKIYIILIFLFALASCKSANEAFSLKKKNSTDEFLVEKKNPLVMPPNFGKLPMPKSDDDNILSTEKDSIEDLISTDKSGSATIKEKNSDTSIEKLILENIN